MAFEHLLMAEIVLDVSMQKSDKCTPCSIKTYNLVGETDVCNPMQIGPRGGGL